VEATVRGSADAADVDDLSNVAKAAQPFARPQNGLGLGWAHAGKTGELVHLGRVDIDDTTFRALAVRVGVGGHAPGHECHEENECSEKAPQ
jgi:hypothetical protein